MKVVEAILRDEKFRRIVLRELFRRALLEFSRIIEMVAMHKKDVKDWWKRELIENRKIGKKDVIRFGALAEKTIQNIRKSTSRNVYIEECSLAYDVIKDILSELEEDIPTLALKIKIRDKSVELNSQDVYRLLLTISSAFGEIRGGIWSEVGKRVGSEVLKRILNLIR